MIGSCWSRQSKILASDGAAADQFGYSVSIYNNAALIGAFGDDDKAANAGVCLYVYECISILCIIIINVFRFCVLLYNDWSILEQTVQNIS